MLSSASKETIDTLTKDELRLEVNKGSRSRFQGDNFAYAKSRLQQIEDGEISAQNKSELDLASEANSIAREANVTASKAWRVSVLAVVVALVAIVVSMCSPK